MKTCFSVFSDNGHGLAVAKEIKNILSDKKIVSDIMEIKINGQVSPGSNNFTIVSKTENTDQYDLIVFVSFVAGFALNPVMKKYMTEMKHHDNIKAVCIAVKHFKSKWTGGTAAVNFMKNKCRDKGFIVKGSGILSKKMENYQEIIKDQAESICLALET